MNQNAERSMGRLSAFTLAIGMMSATSAVLAQAVVPATPEATVPSSEADATSSESDKTVKLEKVQVTGSRIRQANYISPIPLQTVDSRQIELTGQANVGDIIRDLPVAGVSAVTPTNSNFKVSSSGVTTVNLRNLGESRTLVLVNGRRFVSGIAGEQTVDFNSIPTDFIERIDVITGGASAIYGSDALAGAVNIILKEKFDGVSISGQTGQTFDDKDDVKNSYKITGGSSFAEGKGSALFNASWNESKGVFARDRASTALDCSNLAIFGTGEGSDFRKCTDPTFSSFSANTRIQSPRPNAPNDGSFPVQGRTINQIIDATGNVVPFVTARDGFNRNGVRALSTPLERTLLSSILSYEVNPSAKIFFEGTYARTKATSELEPFPLGSDSVFGVLPDCKDTDQNGNLDTCDLASGVPLSSGVVPAALRASVLAANPDLTADTAVLGFARRLTEVGNRGAQSLRQTFRSVTGVEGDLLPLLGGQGFFSDLNYELSFNYGTTSDNQVSNGQLNVSNLREAFNVTTRPDGSVICANPTAREEGCAPVFIFGQNTITGDALNYIQAPVLRDVVIEQIITGGYVSGRFGMIPSGGPVGFSVGVEQRTEKSRDTPDALTQTGQNAGNLIAEQKGSFDVKEAFAEISLPVLVDAPLAKFIELKAAVRASDYSTVNSTIAYSFGADWAINNWARTRAQYSKAVRAPNIGELFSSGGETFEAVNDPCAGVTRDGSGNAAFFNTRQNINNPDAVLASGIDTSTINNATAVSCLADPVVANRVTATGGLALTQAEAQGTGGFVGGSPALGVLTEEKAKSYSYGFVFTPQFGNRWIDALVLSADYYNIKVNDAIDTIDRQLSLDQCYSGAGFGASNPFCSNVRRFGTGSQLGALDEVDGGFLNIASLKTSGIDVQASYRFKISDAISGRGDLGRLLFSTTYTRLLSQKSEAFGVVTNDRGKVTDIENKAVFNVLYTKGPLSANWEVNYLGAADVDVFETDDRAGSLSSVTFHDVQLRYAFGKGKAVRPTLVLGINNLFDKFIEIGGTNGDLGQPVGHRTFSDIYEPFGRAWYAGLKVDL